MKHKIKNQLITKYHSKLLVSNICHTEIIICKRKLTTVNINEEALKIDYIIIFSQYFGNFTQDFFVVWTHDCLCNVSKILAEFITVFNFEKSLIYASPKFN